MVQFSESHLARKNCGLGKIPVENQPSMSLFIHHLFAALQSIYRVNFPGLLAPDTQKCFMTTDKKKSERLVNISQAQQMALQTGTEFFLCRGAGLVKLELKQERITSNSDTSPNCTDHHFSPAARSRSTRNAICINYSARHAPRPGQSRC